jgi:predicted dehydrogenase
MEPLKVGLVGAGGIAQAYVQALAGMECAKLVAVADVRGEAARALAEGLGGRAYESQAAMLKAEKLDAAVVCTPPASHPDICRDLLKKRVHVLCEKPLAITSASAVAMLDAAHASGAKLMMASKFRYAEDVIRAKSIVTSGILGEITLFENAFTSRVDMSSRWNSRADISGGGVLIDNGTHSVDLMRYFLGPLADLQVWEGKRSQGLAVEETVRIFVRSQGGVLGSIDLSWTIDKELDTYLNIYGSHGTVSVGWKQSRYRQSSTRDWVVFGKGYDKLQAFRAQLRNFCGVVRGEEMPLSTPEDALASVEAVESAYEALRENHWRAVANGKHLAGKPA